MWDVIEGMCEKTLWVLCQLPQIKNNLNKQRQPKCHLTLCVLRRDFIAHSQLWKINTAGVSKNSSIIIVQTAKLFSWKKKERKFSFQVLFAVKQRHHSKFRCVDCFYTVIYELASMVFLNTGKIDLSSKNLFFTELLMSVYYYIKFLSWPIGLIRL